MSSPRRIKIRSRKTRSRKNIRSSFGGHIAEFATSLNLFLMIILFPLICLTQATAVACTLNLLATNCAGRCADAHDFLLGVQDANTQAVDVTNSGLGKFAKISPVVDNGVDLFIHETNFITNKTVVYAANSYATKPIDTTTNVYEVEARVNFQADPFVSLAGVPILQNIPYLGKPGEFTFSAMRAVEYPEGLYGKGLVIGPSFMIAPGPGSTNKNPGPPSSTNKVAPPSPSSTNAVPTPTAMATWVPPVIGPTIGGPGGPKGVAGPGPITLPPIGGSTNQIGIPSN